MAANTLVVTENIKYRTKQTQITQCTQFIAQPNAQYSLYTKDFISDMFWYKYLLQRAQPALKSTANDNTLFTRFYSV